MKSAIPAPEKAKGFTAPGFERVVRALERAVRERRESGCAVSAYVGGHKVVDLWCGSADGRLWSEDTLAVVFSCTKGVTALCAQILCSRGLLDLDARVTDYWPEYGVAGKSGTSVRHLLTHKAGVLTYPRYWDDTGPDSLGLANWDMITRKLAASQPSWEPGTDCAYHAMSYGFLVGEIVRRIAGRSLGRFFAEEVSQPLGLDFYSGAPTAVLPRIATILPPPRRDLSVMQPEFRELLGEMESRVEASRSAVRLGKAIELEALLWAATFRHPDFQAPETYLAETHNRRLIQQAELPSTNGIGGARDLARIYAVLAMGGAVSGIRLVSQASIEEFNTPQAEFKPLSPRIPPGPRVCVGYQRVAGLIGPSETAFGHSGAGGSLGFADPERQLSFGFVKNRMRQEPIGAAHDLVQAIYACL